ncbi:erythromycin esterase [Streptomyces abyssalis]|uniref:Erythromycin esterase n=1 Tax=Streptomyces abyssalis TaxID=933944 RepID=A0A1E7JJY0_9ACTN|nr:erythromycin esterase family protein [Streptomyces abyssalis]OEU87409.1 erythromycin esterase [Streptomyces abyssalis]OEU87935.1 erythromycin esterase [Streptomyces abyssalis]
MSDQPASEPAAGEVLADWFREHATTLTTLDPDAPLDDLEALREIAGDARVLAVGENAHFVEEFSLARRRLLRFLAERCGFTVFAFEFGFSEAFALDPWLRGEGDDGDLEEVAKSSTVWLAADLMHWVRRHNRTSAGPVRFAGIDLPTAGGALRPALDPVAGCLRKVDPEALPLLERVLEISDGFLGGAASGAAAAPAWAALGTAEQDALTASLARLLLRLRAMEPLYVARGGQSRFDIARRRVEAACHTDHMFRAMNGLMSGRGSAADLSVREIYMAESVRWHLENAGPEDRIVLMAHNNHIQKTAVEFDGALTSLPMGQHLRRMLGDEYRSVALVHTDDHVPEMYMDAETEVGFTLADAHLGSPEPGSVEAALTGAGLGDAITLTDLRRSPRDAQGEPLLRWMRTQSAGLSTPVSEAFDAVLSVPTVTRDGTVRF